MTLVLERRRAATSGPLALLLSAGGRAARIGGFCRTIRGRILLAFGALAAITFLLGLAGMHSVGGVGTVVVDGFDKPLASISYARLALAKFTAMQTLQARLQADAQPARRDGTDRRAQRLAHETGTYLRLAVSGAGSSRVIAAAAVTAGNVALWDSTRRALDSRAERPGDRQKLARLGDVVLDDFERLVELTAEDGLGARQQAAAAIDDFRRLTLLATLLALLTGAAVTLLLTRFMTRPLASASLAAHRIAAGELDVPISGAGRRDELGDLLGAMTVMRDNIRDMMRREVDAKRAAQDGLAAAVASAPAAMILVDGTGRVALTNSQALDYFPVEAEALGSGQPFPDRIANAFDEPAGEFRVADGRWLKLGKRAMPGGGFVAVAADITGLKEREWALIAARDQAEAASRAKTSFLANMSHELRTPLNAVIGFSEMIAAEMLGPVGQPKYKEFAGDILFSGRHLLEIINHVLDVAKLQWGRMEIERKPTDLRDVVAEAGRIARVQAQIGKVALTIDIDDATPPISGDHTRLRQVVLNLLSNAIKFTPAEGRVDVALRRVGEAVAVSVRDTGIGMRPSDIPKALEPFQQVDSSISRKYGGTGLGLPLSKLLVDLHGGEFTIESDLGQGTVVTMSLPLAAPPEPASG